MGERRVFFVNTEQHVVHAELTAKTALVLLNKQARRNSNAPAYLRADRFRPRSIQFFSGGWLSLPLPNSWARSYAAQIAREMAVRKPAFSR
jgi:hypothetical protein